MYFVILIMDLSPKKDEMTRIPRWSQKTAVWIFNELVSWYSSYLFTLLFCKHYKWSLYSMTYMTCSCHLAVRPDLLCSAVCLLIYCGRPGTATSAAKHRIWGSCCPTPLTLVAVSGVCHGKHWWCIHSLSTMGMCLLIFIHLWQDWCSNTCVNTLWVTYLLPSTTDQCSSMFSFL
jgi:hypothetical protein